MKKINIQNEANINAKGEHTKRAAKPVICIDTGEVYASTTDAAEAAGVHITTMSSVCLGKIRTANGKRYCYLSRVTESLDSIVTRLRETAAVEEDAKRWKAYQAEQEAIRKAEEERIRAEQERIAAIERAKAEREERKRKLEVNSYHDLEIKTSIPVPNPSLLPASGMKQTFLSTNLASSLASEWQAAGPTFGNIAVCSVFCKWTLLFSIRPLSSNSKGAGSRFDYPGPSPEHIFHI